MSESDVGGGGPRVRPPQEPFATEVRTEGLSSDYADCGLCAGHVGESYIVVFEGDPARRLTAERYCLACWERLRATFNNELAAQLADLRGERDQYDRMRQGYMEAANRRVEQAEADIAARRAAYATLQDALQSIANSACCGSCQEAALVAKAALREVMSDGRTPVEGPRVVSDQAEGGVTHPPDNTSRVLALAKEAAWDAHLYARREYDAGADCGASGHEAAKFAECPHGDCVLVRTFQPDADLAALRSRGLALVQQWRERAASAKGAARHAGREEDAEHLYGESESYEACADALTAALQRETNDE